MSTLFLTDFFLPHDHRIVGRPYFIVVVVVHLDILQTLSYTVDREESDDTSDPTMSLMRKTTFESRIALAVGNGPHGSSGRERGVHGDCILDCRSDRPANTSAASFSD